MTGKEEMKTLNGGIWGLAIDEKWEDSGSLYEEQEIEMIALKASNAGFYEGNL